MKNYLLPALLALLVVLTRTVLHLGPNIEFVTASMLAAAILLSPGSVLVVLLGIVVSDLLLGVSQIQLFTWSAFVLIWLAASGRKQKEAGIFTITAYGVMATVWFYLWTNLGVVIVGELYPLSAQGLLQSYVNALPFLRVQLLANLLIVPFVFVAVKLLAEQKYFRLQPALAQD